MAIFNSYVKLLTSNSIKHDPLFGGDTVSNVDHGLYPLPSISFSIPTCWFSPQFCGLRLEFWCVNTQFVLFSSNPKVR